MNAERGEYGPGDIEGKIQRRLERAQQFVPHYFERVRPNGQIIAVSGTPLPQGGFVTTYTDVTETRRRQEKLEQTVQERTRALQQSEDWLRLVTDNIPALIAYMAPGPVFRFANRRYAEWFGHSVASIVGRTGPEVVGEELFREIEPHIAKAFEGNAVSYEYARKAPDGGTVHMRSTLIPDMTKDGRTLGAFVLSLDVSEQKQNEATLLQSQRMDAVGKLTGGLAHDFNNLLTILMGNLLSLSRKHGAVDALEMEKHLTPMLKATRRGSDLTHRLLAFSRGETVTPQTVELSGLIANVSTLLNGSLPASITLTLEPGASRPITAKIDPTQLETALVNLAFNARDAMPDGGTLAIALHTQNIEKPVAETLDMVPGPYAAITVSDSGVGMDEVTKLRVFEPFFTTKTFGTGSGLGMSMVYGFMKQAGGAVDIQSTPGRGTTITLYLPLARGAKAGPRSDGRSDLAEMVDVPHGAGELILLVEDDADVAAVLASQITELGYTVMVAEDAEDARHLAADLPELRGVLSDIVMPGQINGLTLARDIKAARADLGIALMTGYANWTGADGRADDCGFPVLPKPFESGSLARTLKQITDR
ncbi:signal transduction histidine kinase [Roseibium aquae]|uniref:histidine kinase n=1 Tax=Roseibium aquae TaxID=1323746 RepID=A0A916T549_9HYPH|nr:signal transduction histidine kinase [Roseibium aquae]